MKPGTSTAPSTERSLETPDMTDAPNADTRPTSLNKSLNVVVEVAKHYPEFSATSLDTRLAHICTTEVVQSVAQGTEIGDALRSEVGQSWLGELLEVLVRGERILR